MAWVIERDGCGRYLYRFGLGAGAATWTDDLAQAIRFTSADDAEEVAHGLTVSEWWPDEDMAAQYDAWQCKRTTTPASYYEKGG